MKTSTTSVLISIATAYWGVIGLALAQDNIEFEARSGAITAPLVVTGNYISQVITTGVSNGGRAVYSFTLTNSGAYVIKAKVEAPNNEENSFYVSFDADPEDPVMIWDIPVTTGLTNRFVSWRRTEPSNIGRFVPQVFNLSSGDHRLIIVGRTADTKLSHISIVKNSRLGPQPPYLLSLQLKPGEK